MKKKLKIGLFGFGCVGQGLYDILCNNDHFNSEVVAIGVKDRNKKRTLPPEMFVYDKWEILNNEDLDLIIEMISDTEEAFNIVTAALKKGKKVISASKRMIAENFESLYRIQNQYHCSFLYEAAVCGSIPIIRNLEEYFDNEPLKSVYGIFNGSSNYILSKIHNENLTYAEALKQAQDLGFAEIDPTLDVGGHDAANKLAIIIVHAFGIIISPDQIFAFGIQNLSQAETEISRKHHLKLKLQAKTTRTDKDKLAAYVIPAFIDRENPLYYVENELNTVLIEGRFSGTQQFRGKGAGGHPTGSAILSDISASLYHYKYEYKKMEHHESIRFDNNVNLKLYIRYKTGESLSDLGFENIESRGSFGEYSIAIGEANLKRLPETKILQAKDIFIADLSNLPANSDIFKSQAEKFEYV